MSEPEPQQIFHFLIPDRNGARLLVHKTPQGFSLPNLVEPDDLVVDEFKRLEWTYDTDKFVKRVFSELAIRVYPRVLLREQPKPFGTNMHILLAADLVSRRTELPDGMQWISRDDALKANWPLIHPDLDLPAMVNSLFSEVADGVIPVNRPAWRRAGWFREITTWALSVLKSNGFNPIEDEIEPWRNAEGGAVVRCRFKQPPFDPEKRCPPEFAYVKCSVPASQEAKKTAIVSSLFPEIVPKVLAVHPEMNAMVQLQAFDRTEPQLAIADCLWRFQRGSLDVIDKLREGGIPDRGPKWLASAIDGILDHPVLHPKSDKLIELEGRIGEIKHVCERLSEFNIPLTLVHGDYVEENFGVFEGPNGSDVAIFDWYTCCIGHPLYDFVRGNRGFAFGIVDEEAQKWYLGKWEEFESQKNIDTARLLLEPLLTCQNVFDLQAKYDSMEASDQRVWCEVIREQAEDIVSSLDDLKLGKLPETWANATVVQLAS